MASRMIPLTLALVAACAPSVTPTDTGPSTDVPEEDARPEPIDSGAALDAPATGTCDLEAQTGCPDGEKCTLVASARGDVRGCVPILGSVPEGEPCARTDEGFGHDDCAPGTTCTFIGVLPPRLGGTRRCRSLCTADSTCGPGERCALLTSEIPAAGFCGATCTPFGAECSAPLECTRLWAAVEDDPPGFLSCRATGELAEGAPCDPVAEDCAAGLVCFGGFATAPACLRPCDDVHPCATGACNVLDEASGFGVCLP